MRKLFSLLLAVMLIAGMFTISSSAAAKDVSDQTKFIYVFQDMANPTSILTKDAVKYEAEEFEDINEAPGMGTRPCPEGERFMIWQQGDAQSAYSYYNVKVDKAGEYELIIVGTAVRDKPTSSRRGIAWWLDGGEKSQIDIEPIISRSYTYDNNPETGYAVGYAYGIKLNLKAGVNKLYFGHHEEYGKSGRLNWDCFYIQPWQERAPETTAAPATTAPETTTAPVLTTAAPAQTPATGDATIYLVIAIAAASLVAAVSIKRRAR